MKREPINIAAFLGDLFASRPGNAALAGVMPGGGRTGRGRRSVDQDHKRIRDAMLRDTPGAERMRAVVARRRANWMQP